jgi:sulfoxide reductase heme-binding subunit YedZ
MNIAPHLLWITSRAAGEAALLLSSASVGLGLMVSSKGRSANKRDFRAVHEALSLTALAMVAMHGIALLGDGWLHPGISGIAIPFVGAYRPLWTGVGIVAGYGLAALGISYYARNRIGPARWKRIHRLTAVFWLLAVGHSAGAGTDASQLWFLAASAALVLPAAALLALRWTARAAEAEEARQAGEKAAYSEWAG